MRSTTRPERRGAALLLVLATLVLLTSAGAALGRLASTVGARRSFDVRTATADDLVRQAELVALAWLDSESTQIVLAPNVPAPEVAILSDTWQWGDARYRVQITAWDQEGLVPYGAARSGSPLRTAIPEDLRRVLDRSRPSMPMGLDQFESPAGRRSPYPRPRAQRAETFGEVRSEPELDELPRALRTAIGAYVATHNSGPERINVNTAPMAVVEAAMRLRGVGGVEAVEEARARGFLATVASASPRDETDRGPAPELVSRSESWAFRIDVSSGPVARSWWAVFEYTGSWTLVQRLAIPG